METIIVPIDFSDMSLNGLRMALVMEEISGAKIELVHVIEKEAPKKESQRIQEKEQIEQKFESLLSSFQKDNSRANIHYHIKHGKVYEEIVNQAEAHDNSVLVTSTHGGSGLEELFLGSNAYKIVSATSRPVITVKGSKIPEKIKKIVLPIDSSNETREKVPFTAKLAEIFQAEVLIVTVNSSNLEDIKEKIEAYAEQSGKYFDQKGVAFSIENLHGDNITDMTLEFAEKNGADLISIMSEQEKSISNILLGTYAHQMINKSSIPVLVFPARHIGIITESFRTLGINY